MMLKFLRSILFVGVFFGLSCEPILAVDNDEKEDEKGLSARQRISNVFCWIGGQWQGCIAIVMTCALAAVCSKKSEQERQQEYFRCAMEKDSEFFLKEKETFFVYSVFCRGGLLFAEKKAPLPGTTERTNIDYRGHIVCPNSDSIPEGKCLKAVSPGEPAKGSKKGSPPRFELAGLPADLAGFIKDKEQRSKQPYFGCKITPQDYCSGGSNRSDPLSAVAALDSYPAVLQASRPHVEDPSSGASSVPAEVPAKVPAEDVDCTG